MFYPGEEQSFIINAREIQLELNGKIQITDTIIVEFSKSFIGNADAFQRDFNTLIKQIENL